MADANFSPKLAAALVKVMANVKKLAKTEKNTFARYDFVSIDRFLEAVGPICAEQGVIILCDELSASVQANAKGKDQLTVEWAFTFVHESGESAGPFRRSVTVPAEGAQAYGSAQSYALKQFLRGTFQIPTGDKDDPDFREAQPIAKKADPYTDWHDILAPADEYGVQEGHLPAARAREAWSAVVTTMKMAKTQMELATWAEENAGTFWQWPRPARSALREEFDKFMSTLPKEAA